jgi:O-methyltransferase involved in polyketide biosynthesis
VLVGQAIHPVKTTAFINEGVAVYFDESGQDRFAAARTLLAGKDINIRDLWENPVNFPEEYNYAVGGAWIAYLFKNGTTEQIKKLLKDQPVASAKAIYPELDVLAYNFAEKLAGRLKH